jgi:hypothetical protein
MLLPSIQPDVSISSRMERTTRPDHFSSAAFSIADDLLHRNILLLRAISGREQMQQ